MEEKKRKGKRKIYRKLKNKFRLVVMNDDSFEQKFSLILSPLNVFAWGGFVLIALILITSSIIAFTPLREFIPGYADVNTRKLASIAALKADSLTHELELKTKYLENLRNVMSGRNLLDEDTVVANQPSVDLKQLNFVPSKEDSLLRVKIEKEDKYNLSFNESTSTPGISNFFFFTPLNGMVSSKFNIKKGHFGVDVIAAKNEVIKSALEGTVIIATWTAETGHIIQIQHANNMISVYKHNSVLLKEAGDHVKAGDEIAIIGESGELSTGPHLHFELWYNGNPINPEEFIIF